MKRRLVVRIVVHALEDINLSSSRPVWSVTPKGWPSGTPGWHVYGVHDNKTPGKVILRLDPDALAVPRDLRSSFDLHDNISGRIHTDESAGLRILHAEEIDVSVGGIGKIPKVPTVKEARAFSSLN